MIYLSHEWVKENLNLGVKGHLDVMPDEITLIDPTVTNQFDLEVKEGGVGIVVKKGVSMAELCPPPSSSNGTDGKEGIARWLRSFTEALLP